MPEFFSSPIVCNTGPIIALAKASLGHLLEAIFPEVIVPSSVRDELLAKDAGDRDAIEAVLNSATVIELALPPDPLLIAELDAGEASVIACARELKHTNVLIDERRARRIASTVYHLSVRGTCALLIEAKRRDSIAEVGPALDQMMQGGYFIGPALRNECLRRAGEHS